MSELTIEQKRALLKRGKKNAKVRKAKWHKPLKSAEEIPSSKVELRFEKVLNNSGVKLKPQYQLGFKFYDFIVEGTNILIEFDGDYFHCNPKKYPNGAETKTQKKNILNDVYKDSLAKTNGFVLIRVWESDFNDTPTEVIKKIKKIIKEHKK